MTLVGSSSREAREGGAEGLERLRVELAQVAAQSIDVTLALPHEALMCPGKQFDRFGELGIPGDLAVVVTVGAHDVGEHLGVTGVRFRSRGRVPIAIAVHRQRIDREHLVAGCDESADQQPTVELDPDDGLFGFLDVVGDHLVELGDSLDTVCDPAPSEDRTFLIDDADIVMLLGPVDPDEDQTFLLSA